MFDQALYEQDQAGPTSEWSVTDEEWAERCMTSVYAVRQAKEQLVNHGLIRAERRGLPARTFYFVDLENAAEAFLSWVARTPRTSYAKSNNLSRGFEEHSLHNETGTATETVGSEEEKEIAPGKPARGKKPLGPGATVYREVVHLTPNHVQRETIEATAHNIGLANLRTGLEDWMNRGWNPRNVAGQMDHATKLMGTVGGLTQAQWDREYKGQWMDDDG